MLTGHRISREASSLAPVLILGLLCLGPYLGRLKHASLYADDVARIADLQTRPLGAMLFRPFNEHIAPLFEGVSWLTWQLVGRRLANAPLAFTLAAYLPFALTLLVLRRVVDRETGSKAAALAAVAVFSLSWLAIETVYWYSASSFMWALLMALAAWSATTSRLRLAPWFATAAAATAPAFSAIGLLAGPVAAVRALADPTSDRARRFATAASTLTGTLAYLAAYGASSRRALLTPTMEQMANFSLALRLAFRAPADALLPALFGLGTRNGSSLALGVTVSMVLCLLFVAARDPKGRPLLLGGLCLVFGGYGLTFAARAGEVADWVIETQRYHLFPMIGLVMLLTPFIARIFSRWESRPAVSIWLVVILAAGLHATHFREMRGRGAFFRHPDQVRTLAAFDRLGSLCAELGITRAQALAALDAIETEWTPRGFSALEMLGRGAGSSRVPDDQVRAALFAKLGKDDLASVCGGMDATRFVDPVTSDPSVTTVAAGRPVDTYRLVDRGAERYETAGYPSFLEYRIEPTVGDAHALELTGATPGGLVDLWWRGEGQRWSETRSVRLRLRPGRMDSRLDLENLPHWSPADSCRFRLLFHEPGSIALEEVNLVR